MSGRSLAWEACLNARDLGGLLAANGRRVRRGALVRSDALCKLNERGRAALMAHGVRTVIDLRTPTEVAGGPDPFGDGDGVDYLLVSQQDEELWRELRPIASTRAARDALVLDRRAERMVAMARAFVNAAPGGIVIHCLAGKDRTGIAVALLLALLGVDETAIVEDYALSGPALAPLLAEALASAPDDDARARIQVVYDSRAEVMASTLSHLRTRHGGAQAYLARAGLTDGEAMRIRARLLE